MKTYNWQQSDWPNFRYQIENLHEILLKIAEKSGLIQGKLSHLTNTLQAETMINTMVEEAINTSQIEGEYLSRPDVRLSIQNKLGLNPGKLAVKDKRAKSIVDMMFDVRKTYAKSLTANKLFNWHLMLLSNNQNPHLTLGTWRNSEEPMQVVSGHHNKWIVHFEAPPSNRVPFEMKRFLHWFNETVPGKTKAIKFAPIRAAIAHLYFESIHPFDDGNGRIGRAIAEKALSQGFGYPVILSLSKIIDAEKKEYYSALHAASQSNEITNWIKYFVNVVLKAQIDVENEINFILKKSNFFVTFAPLLNERQLKVIQRMFHEGAKGFEGGMSAKKYMIITGASKATATRDLQQLHAVNAFKQTGSGRSVRYELNLDFDAI